MIDGTILKPDTTLAEVKKLCEEAKACGFAAVCVPPFYVKEAVKSLEGSTVKTCTVVGFPMGYSATPAKVEEIKKAIDEGAVELDCVINIAAVKSKQWNYVRNEVESMSLACQMRGKIIKLIIETGLINEAEMTKLCEIATEVKVDFVKTSTGINGKGASVAIIESLRSKLPSEIKLKASGGIRDRKFAEELVAAGADRIGTSVGAAIVGG